MAYIEIENVSFKYPQSNDFALKNVNLSFEKGSVNLVLGKSASGKSTLLSLLCKEIAPNGDLTGDINISGAKVSFVHQNTETSLVCDKVFSELAFPLENMGYSREKISLKIAETACFFNIEDLFERNVSELSGGQKRIVALASAMVCEPDLLVIDEPVSCLDPLSAENFISALIKINKELGVTIILSEHISNGIVPHCDTVSFMENGKTICTADTQNATREICKSGYSDFMPFYVRINEMFSLGKDVPLSVKDAKINFEKKFSSENITVNKIVENEKIEKNDKKKTALTVKDAYFSYSKNQPFVLKSCDYSACFGKVNAILGCNGSGKSTLLKIIASVLKSIHGKVKIHGKVALMPQNPLDLFCEEKNSKELSDCDKDLIEKFEVEKIFDSHPYDISGGEARMAAFVKVLSQKPDILLLDEPTAGCDIQNKKKQQQILRELADNGVCVVLVSHDMEFVSEVSDSVSLIFNGEIVETLPKRDFFSSVSYYTTDAYKISRSVFENSVIQDDVEYLLKRNGVL